MTREYLETLTREELIDLVLQLHAVVTELKAKVAELEAKLANKSRSPKISSNFSIPPSWVFVTEKATYHVIAPSRGSGVMGEAQPVVWVRDLWSAQCKGPGKHHQLCHAHQLRDLQYVVDSERSHWAYRMQRLLLHSQRLVKYRGRSPPKIFQQEVEKVEATL